MSYILIGLGMILSGAIIDGAHRILEKRTLFDFSGVAFTLVLSGICLFAFGLGNVLTM